MTTRRVLPMLALALLLPSSGCGKQRPEPIPAVPEQLVCPAPAIPPAQLMERPRKIDFLPPTPEG